MWSQICIKMALNYLDKTCFKNSDFYGVNFDHYALCEQKYSNLRTLPSITFPQGFRISKNIGHSTSGRGAKRPLKKTKNRRRQIKSEEKNFFLRGNLRQFSKKNVHI